uniref:Uncharacterized protein n=1 Tax=viral metagenome TaxID=1070528 RepID=A0A6C0J6C8_9ZZZZ
MYNNINYEEYNTSTGFITDHHPLIKGKMPVHSGCENIKKVFPDIFDSYFKFCVVRNPYDRIVSRYFWDLKINEIKKNLSFKEYLENEDKKRINK